MGVGGAEHPERCCYKSGWGGRLRTLLAVLFRPSLPHGVVMKGDGKWRIKNGEWESRQVGTFDALRCGNARYRTWAAVENGERDRPQNRSLPLGQFRARRGGSESRVGRSDRRSSAVPARYRLTRAGRGWEEYGCLADSGVCYASGVVRGRLVDNCAGFRRTIYRRRID